MFINFVFERYEVVAKELMIDLGLFAAVYFFLFRWARAEKSAREGDYFTCVLDDVLYKNAAFY